jgi:anti-anti-sigma regulatory factor
VIRGGADVHVDDNRTATAREAGGGLTMTLDRRYGHARVVRLRGVLTGDSAVAVRGAVIEQLALVPALLVLELSGITFVDRGGVESLWCVAERAERADIDLRLVASGPAWMHLSTVGVLEIAPVYPTVEDALRVLGP